LGERASTRSPSTISSRRQRDQRDQAGGERRDRAADRHRVQKALREDEQREHRRRHRHRAEDDRPPGGAQCAFQGPRAVAVARDLLAIARQDEQRVVDRQTQPEPDREVQREDRQRRRLVEEPQAEKRGHDRQQADEQRQQRRDRAAEHEQREQEQQREGEHLGPREILGDLLADGGPGDGQAADLDTRLGAEPLVDAQACLLAVGAGAHEHRDEARAAVARDERAGRPRVNQRGSGLRDASVGLDRFDNAAQLRAAGLGADRPVGGDEHDDPRAQPAADRLAQGVARDLALRLRIDEVDVGIDREHARDRGAEADRQGEERDRRDEHAARMRCDEAGDRREHR
jgi:hypothetical protein